MCKIYCNFAKNCDNLNYSLCALTGLCLYPGFGLLWSFVAEKPIYSSPHPYARKMFCWQRYERVTNRCVAMSFYCDGRGEGQTQREYGSTSTTSRPVPGQDNGIEGLEDKRTAGQKVHRMRLICRKWKFNDV